MKLCASFPIVAKLSFALTTAQRCEVAVWRDYEAIALTPEEALKVLEQLQQPEYTMIVLVAAIGIRASELLGLRWSDILWGRSEIKIRQTYVHRNIQSGAKTKLSKSTSRATA